MDSKQANLKGPHQQIEVSGKGEDRKIRTTPKAEVAPSGEDKAGPPAAPSQLAAETVAEDGRPTIRTSTEEHLVSMEAAKALCRDQTIFQRENWLVRLLEKEGPTVKGIQRPKGTHIELLPKELLRHIMSANMVFTKQKANKKGDDGFLEEEPVHPPSYAVNTVYAFGNWPGVRHLATVVDSPIILDNGDVLDQPGYHPDSGLFQTYSGPLLQLKDRPSKDDTHAACQELLEIVADFPFKDDSHRSAWLAAVLTPIARFAFHGPAPLFLVDGNVAGIGKGKLLEVASRIVSGKGFSVMTYTNDTEALRKLVLSLAVEGDRLILMDNLKGKFGNHVLDAALTATVWKDRKLGHTRILQAPLFGTWYATGNNVAIAADTARRTVHIRLESRLERPEERRGFRHPDLMGYIDAERHRLLSAGLTILRAYILAGCPPQDLTPFGSFEGWDALVRNALV